MDSEAELPADQSVILEMDETEDGDVKINMADVPYLPPEMLVAIFSMLPVVDKGRCSRVCRRWNEASCTPLIWQGVWLPFTREMTPSNNPTLSGSLKLRGIVRAAVTFSQEGSGEVMCDLLDDLRRCIPDLQSLSIDVDNVSSLTLTCEASLFVSMTQLTRLVIVNSEKVSCDYVPTVTVELIAAHLTSLVRFDMRGFFFTDLLLMIISRGLANLTHLTLGKCVAVTNVGIRYLTGHSGEVDVVRPRLLYLNLLGCTNLTDQTIKYLGEGQATLRGFSFQCTLRQGDDSLESVASLVNLEAMSLLGSVSPGSFRHLMPLSRLRVLHLSSCGTIGDEDMLSLSKLASLRELVVSSVFSIGDASWGGLARMPSLRKLSLLFCHLSDAGLQVLADCGSRISQLSISYPTSPDGVWSVTDRGLLHISRLSGLRHLKLVQRGSDVYPALAGMVGDIWGCGFRHLSTGRARITRLDISCNQWRCPQLMMHVSRMSHLANLVLHCEYRVEDVDVRLLAESLPWLKIERKLDSATRTW